MHPEGMQGHSKEPRIPREASKEDKEAEDEPAEGAISLAQLKIGRSYGKVLFKKFLLKMAEWWREQELDLVVGIGVRVQTKEYAA